MLSSKDEFLDILFEITQLQVLYEPSTVLRQKQQNPCIMDILSA